MKSCNLKPIKASKEYYANSTDEYPILFAIAALTKGISVFKGIKDLANKESNRIKEMQNLLNQIGIKTKAGNDQLKIFGKGLIDASERKVKISNLGDHRMYVCVHFIDFDGAKTTIKILILSLLLRHPFKNNEISRSKI